MITLPPADHSSNTITQRRTTINELTVGERQEKANKRARHDIPICEMMEVNNLSESDELSSMQLQRPPVSSPDDILVQMVQSNQYSHDEVVQFCIQSGIPISRMLRLDLMRLKNTKKY